MQVPADLRRTASRGQSTAAWLTLLTLLASMIVPLQAQATVNADINLSGLALVKSDRSGNDFPSEGLTTQDVAKLSYTWDATNTTVNPGDSFSIDLGANFKNLENPENRPPQPSLQRHAHRGGRMQADGKDHGVHLQRKG